MKGFNELNKRLNELKNNAENLGKESHVSLEVLFNQSFMQQHTRFNSFDEFLKSGNFVVNSQEDFDSIPDDDLDKYVASETDFDNWQDMLGTAGTEYTAKKLGF